MENNKYPGEIGGNQEKGCVRKHYKCILMFKRGDDKYIWDVSTNIALPLWTSHRGKIIVSLCNSVIVVVLKNLKFSN